MKGIIEYEGRKIKYYLCDKCREEVTCIFCFVLDPSRPNRKDNWIALCGECTKEYRLKEVKGNVD